MQKARFYFTALLLIIFINGINAQRTYFVDGYHGGVYGHYPLWQTQFMVDTLLKYNDWKINLELEPETWDSVKTKDPEGYKNFKALFDNDATASRIEFVNPAYGQSYLYMASGESMIRQFAYGMKKIKGHFPQATFITYSSEEPCFTSALPQVLKSFGFKYAVLKNPNTCWGGYVKNYGGEIMNWIGPDGTSIKLVPRYASEQLEENSTWQTTAWENSKEYINSAIASGVKNPVGMCLQDAGWKNGKWLGKNRNNAEYTTWKNYFEHVADTLESKDWLVSQQDMRVSLVWGSQVLQQIAQQVRVSENKILRAEKIATMSGILNGDEWQGNLFDSAWRTLLLSQHHDCWIVPYNGHKGDTWIDKVARWTKNTNDIAGNILQQATANKSNDASFVTIYNSSLMQRKEMVSVPLLAAFKEEKNLQVKDGNKVKHIQVIKNGDEKVMLFPASVEPLSVKTCKIEISKTLPAKAAAVTTDGSAIIMQTDLYKMVIDTKKGGAITSLVAKTLDSYEFVDKTSSKSFNALQGNFFDEGGKAYSALNEANVEILENGPWQIRVAVHNKIASHAYTQIITMEQGEQRIDVSLKIDWNKNVRIGEDYKQHGGYDARDLHKAFYNDTDKLVVTFPLKLNQQKVAVDAPFDITNSQLVNTFYNRWDSIKNNVVLNWVDVTNASNAYGMAVLTDHTTSYSHGENFPLALTVQYAGVGLWGRDYAANGTTAINYALVPHKTSWKQAQVYSTAEKWNEPLFTAVGKAEQTSKSLIDCGASKWVLSSFTKSADKYLLRLFNAEGDNKEHQLKFNFPVKQVAVVDLAGNELKNNVLKNGNVVSLSIPEKGFVTLEITTK